MSSKSEKDKTKQLQDKCQSVLNALLRDEDNKYCVDCDSKGPRWASWNLGVFLCIRCAGIHRNLGVHISKVKSVNLDAWTPEQVVSLQQMGNSRARAVYEANLPDNFRRPQSDISLETFIRAKYEQKKYIAKEWVPPSLPEINWEKEIDEEIERQKRKKKTVLEKKSLGAVEVPQLPKPKNASPKPGRVTQPLNTSNALTTTTTSTLINNKQNADLLGLQNGDDGFSNFLSAPVSSNTTDKKLDDKSAADAAIKSEEESFFSQTAPSEQEKAKMTKDSIMALYGAAPPINNFNYQQTAYMQPPTQQQLPFQNFVPFTQQQQQPIIQNSQFQPQFHQTPQQQQQQPQTQNQFQNFMPQAVPANYQFQNQFTAAPPLMQTSQLTNQFTMNLNQFPTQQQQPQTMTTSNFPQQQQQQPQMVPSAGLPTAAPNPFFNQRTLQQQFGNLALNGQTNNASAAPPTHVWQ